MKIVKSDAARGRLRADLARLSTSKYLEPGLVENFLAGKLKLDHDTSSLIHNANRAITYIETLKESQVRITRYEHIVSLLCAFSQNSVGSEFLDEEFQKHTKELQAYLDECTEKKFNGVKSAIHVMAFLGFSDFIQGRPFNVWYLLYNMFLIQSGICLILEDTDTPGSQLLYDMKYKVEAYAAKLS